FGFERDDAEQLRMLEKVNAVSPDLLIVGLGAPKQELWLSKWRYQLRAKVAIAAGATIDFLAGEQKRAPKLFQSLRLEWLYRACSAPIRRGPRYLGDALGLGSRLTKSVARQLLTPSDVDLEPDSIDSVL